MSNYQTIITAAGLALEAAANASGAPVVLLQMAAGDGNGNPVDAPAPGAAITSLQREVFRASINALEVDPVDHTLFTAELIIPAESGGFTLREVGLFNDAGTLFAYGNLPDTYKPVASEGSFADTIVRMVFKVANADTVQLIIDPNSVIATRTWVLNGITLAYLLPGGLTGQFLAKATNADGDVEWVDPTTGITVLVHSREETQTAAAAQTVFNLAIITSDGTAVYKNGVRLRANEFTVTGATQVTLAAGAASGDKLTFVQNEEVGNLSGYMKGANNLSDVTDVAQARTNLGIPAYTSDAIANATIQWGKLAGVPVYATRWAAWGEVTGKPLTFAPSAHTHPISDVVNLQSSLDGKQDDLGFTPVQQGTGVGQATNVVKIGWSSGAKLKVTIDATDKGNIALESWVSSTYAPLASPNFTGTAKAVALTLTGALTGVSANFGAGTVTAGKFAQSSSLRYKTNVESIDPRTALSLLSSVRWAEWVYTADKSLGAGVIAEELADGPFRFAVVFDADGRPDRVDYQPLFAYAVAALAGLAEDVAALKAKA